MEGVLRESPQLPSHEVLERAKLERYTGGKSALYGLIAAVRPKSVDLLVRFEGLPGEFSHLSRTWCFVKNSFLGGHLKSGHHVDGQNRPPRG